MHSLSAFLPALLLSFPLFHSGALAGSQNITIPGLPLCWQQCLDSSSGSNCDSSSVDSYTSCICNLASQSLLTNAITCVQSTCSSTLTSSLPLEILQAACTAVGKPLDSSALAAAQSAERSAAIVSDYSYPTSSDGGPYGAAPVTATQDVGSATAITVDGSSASASGMSSTAGNSSGISATPVSLSSSSSGDGALAGAGASPSTSATGPTSTAASSVSETGTTDAAASRTATPSSSQATSHSSTAGADSAVKTEGAPLGMQGTGTRKDAGSVLGLTVWLIAGIAWF